MVSLGQKFETGSVGSSGSRSLKWLQAYGDWNWKWDRVDRGQQEQMGAGQASLSTDSFTTSPGGYPHGYLGFLIAW